MHYETLLGKGRNLFWGAHSLFLLAVSLGTFAHKHRQREKPDADGAEDDMWWYDVEFVTGQRGRGTFMVTGDGDFAYPLQEFSAC